MADAVFAWRLLAAGAVAGVEVELVGAHGVIQRGPLSRCWNLAFERVARSGFASFRGQHNRPGLWWFSGTGDHPGMSPGWSGSADGPGR